MENASDALKIAFALIVFTMAIATLFILTTHTRSTADEIFEYVDDTNYYDHINATDLNRNVEVSEVVSSLYRYYKESICVTVNLTKGCGGTYVFDIGRESYRKSPGFSLDSIENIEENLGSFLKDVLLTPTHRNSTFTEQFVEVPQSGVYSVDDNDYTEFTLISGSKKIFITYQENLP